MPNLSSDRESNFYSLAEKPSSHFLVKDEVDGECYVSPEGQRYCNHDHVAAPHELQDVYQHVEGWTAQTIL